MVYLALTPQGLQEILDTPEAAEAPVMLRSTCLIRELVANFIIRSQERRFSIRPVRRQCGVAP